MRNAVSIVAVCLGLAGCHVTHFIQDVRLASPGRLITVRCELKVGPFNILYADDCRDVPIDLRTSKLIQSLPEGND